MRTNDRQSWKHRAKNQQKWAWTITWRSDQTIWRNKKDLTQGRTDHYSATKSTKPENSRRCYLFTAWNLGPCLWLVGLALWSAPSCTHSWKVFLHSVTYHLELTCDRDTVKMNLLSRIATCSKKAAYCYRCGVVCVCFLCMSVHWSRPWAVLKRLSQSKWLRGLVWTKEPRGTLWASKLGYTCRLLKRRERCGLRLPVLCMFCSRCQTQTQ